MIEGTVNENCETTISRRNDTHLSLLMMYELTRFKSGLIGIVRISKLIWKSIPEVRNTYLGKEVNH